MNSLVRWVKFNLVGVVGMALQLSTLALFNHWMSGHYLYASAAAIELTLLHNFTWHMHFTWRDRRDRDTRLGQLVRFHLSNGLVSMLGNLALMRIFIHSAHLPLLGANGIAILCCSIANFYLGDKWAFAEAPQNEPPQPAELSRVTSHQALPLMLLLSGTGSHEETGTRQPMRSTCCSRPGER